MSVEYIIPGIEIILMGGAEYIIPLLAIAGSAAGTGVQLSANASANRRREEEIGRIEAARRMQQIETSKSSKKQLALTRNEVEKYAPQKRSERLDKAAQKITGELNQELSQKRGENVDIDFSGDVSNAYTRGKAVSMARSLEDSHTLATLMGRLRAPGQVVGNEALSYANTAALKNTESSRLGALNRLYENTAEGRSGVLGSIYPDDAAMIGGELLKTGALASTYYRPKSNALTGQKMLTPATTWT